MLRSINETPNERRKDSTKVLTHRANGRKRPTPASREEWAEVLATAERYY